MNCLKCPVSEECNTSKMTMETLYLAMVGMSIPSVIAPQNESDCPLIVILVSTVTEE